MSDISAGNIGYIWPQADENVDLTGPPERGYIERLPEDLVRVRTLEEDVPSGTFGSADELTRRPYALVGQFEDGGVLALDVSGIGSSRRFGGSRASINRYRTRVLVTGVPVSELRSSSLFGVHVHFPGVSDWIGSATSKVETTFREDGRQKGVTVTVDPPDPLELPLTSDLTLEIGTHWQLDGPEDHRTLYAPFYVGVKAGKPVGVLDLLEPIIYLQDLLNLAHRGFMRAGGGRAILDSPERPGRAPEVWSHQTMVLPRGGMEPTSRTALPAFSLATIGGAEAIPRWIELARNHPRFVEPIVDRYRYGPVSASAYLREVCAAIEYWRGVHVRKMGWADEKFYPRAVANSLGQPFLDWLGVPVERWCDKLWEAYNSSKHYNARSVVREEEVQVLALSAGTMITAAALAHISAVDWTIESFLDAHWTSDLQRRVQDVFG